MKVSCSLVKAPWSRVALLGGGFRHITLYYINVYKCNIIYIYI